VPLWLPTLTYSYVKVNIYFMVFILSFCYCL
jgi:hypothetical protein